MDVIGFLYFLVALLVTLTVHESSHAMVAYYLGDPTAKMKGRMTLNPIPHLDLMGSLVFILTQRIGWGKPVPINPANFKNPVRDSALTALAGPMSNFILAFIVVLQIHELVIAQIHNSGMDASHRTFIYNPTCSRTDFLNY